METTIPDFTIKIKLILNLDQIGVQSNDLMSYLNANIPPIYCQVRKEYLYDLKEHHGESEDCVVFGVASITKKALLFHIMLPNGAVFYRLPISAFFKKHISRSEVPDMSSRLITTVELFLVIILVCIALIGYLA
jgi:hypothetical protein